MSKPIKLLMIVVDFAIEEISRYKDPEKVKEALDHLQKAYLSLEKNKEDTQDSNKQT